MLKKIIFLAFILGIKSLSAQNITIEFPAFAGKTYDFIIFQGDAQIKVAESDTIPTNGIIEIKIPKQYTPYTGMCRWLLTNSPNGGGLDMAIPGHGFRVSCLSDKPNENNIVWHDYDAMNELNRLNVLQQKIIDKFETMSKALELYDATHPIYVSLQQEVATQKQAYSQFQQDLKNNTNYNARFLPIVNLTKGISDKLSNNYEEKAKSFSAYITNELNFEQLYTSGHWGGIIQSWAQMQAQLIQNKEVFVTDFKTISSRIVNPKIYTDFVGKVTYYLTQYGKDDYIDDIASTVVLSGKITSYDGNTMQVYVKAKIGNQAPDLIIADKNKNTILKSKNFAQKGFKKTIVIFYESGCGFCEDLLTKLAPQYETLKKRGIDIITLSADMSKEIYQTTAEKFPWKRKFCDFQGMSGINFKNYAVIGTPFIFQMDQSGKLEKKLSTYDDIMEVK